MSILTTPLILDVIVAALAVICFIVGWKRGLISTLLGLAGFAIALLGSWWASGKLAAVIYDRFMKDKLVDALSQKIANDAVESGTWGVLNGFINKILTGAAGESTGAASETIVDGMLAEPATALVRAILFIVLFLVLLLVVKLIARAFKGLNKVPVIGGVNRIGGGVIGLAEGLLFCYLVVAVVAIIVTLTADSLGWLNTGVIGESRLFSLLYNFNPLKAIADSGILS